jgi:hypothetical protein
VADPPCRTPDEFLAYVRLPASSDSSKTLEEVAEQYTFMFMREAGIRLTAEDEADIVAFLKLL